MVPADPAGLRLSPNPSAERWSWPRYFTRGGMVRRSAANVGAAAHCGDVSWPTACAGRVCGGRELLGFGVSRSASRVGKSGLRV
ncbi:hypothetical protein NL676_035116 [Syzygium grande]|nr:hypothetical protein NL676_035116 [Syzygium grande]